MSTQDKTSLSYMLKNMVCACSAAIITVCFTHPIDVVKTRMQIMGEAGRVTKAYSGVFGTIRTVYTTEGLRAIYKGLNAGMLREGTNTTARLSLFDPMK